MNLKRKLSQLFAEKSSRDKIEYSRVSLEKNKAKRKNATAKRNISKPIPYSSLPPEIHHSIETLPVWYWWEIERTGNVKLLSLKGSKSKLYKYLFYCSAVWDDMNDQHISEFGIPQSYMELSMAKANLAIAKARYSVSQDGTDKMDLRLADADLRKLNPSSKPISNYKTKGRIEAALNIQRIDPRQTTVIEYYSLMEQAQEINDNGGRN